jgi:predicted methyltransferase
MNRTFGYSLGAALLLVATACGDDPATEAEIVEVDETETSVPADTAMEETAEPMAEQAAPRSGRTLPQIIADEGLRGERMARDVYRHPLETLNFFGLEPDMVVVEASPASGWYTDIIASYLATGGGTLYAAHFDPETDIEFYRRSRADFEARYLGDPERFGDVRMTVLSPEGGPVAPAESADLVLTFRNVHNWRQGDWAQKAFDDFYAALKPGGTLGVVAHRLPETTEQEGPNTWGYTKESTVIELAENAGFTLLARSEVNANPKDKADHPYGVRTLPPASRTPREDEEVPPGFDAEAYLAIGESDRMTLKFIKPLDPDAAALE